MARRDTRSPSPTGSNYSKRVRREDDRHRDGKDRRRSRSRSADRRPRDRDDRRRNRSVDRHRGGDRYDDSSYRPGRRDRSRERRRSRSPRDRRDRDRDRDRGFRSRRDDDREHRRRNSRDRRDDDRRGDRGASAKAAEEAAAATKAAEEEKKKAEKLAKLEAWKAKQVAERERKQKESAALGTRNLLNEMDRKAAGSPSVGSPSSPAPTSGPDSPAPYTGKFDPKAIAKRALGGHASSSSALGIDVPVPVKPGSTTSISTAGATKGVPAKVGMGPPQGGSLKPLKASGNVNRFGLGAKADKSEKKGTLNFGDEESTKRKLEKLPTLPTPDSTETSAAEGNPAEADDDEGEDFADAGTEEEAAAAARAAAEKREERLQTENTEVAPGTENDVDMQDATGADVQDEMQVDEDVDPLDAFMADLGDEKPNAAKKPAKRNALQEPQAIFGGDDDGMDAVEADEDILIAAASKKKKKEIPTVDHAKVDYEPFRKDFYVELPELRDLTEEEAADLRLELDGIKVRGVDVPRPVRTWTQCGLGVQTLDVVDKLGYDAPTAIQSQAIPAIMAGRDVIGVAKTGSGKTIAFLMPMFRHIKDQRPLSSMEGPVGLIMTPTRELATQIHRECKPFLKALGLRAVCAYGGAPIKDQIAELKRGAEIVVCTPGRMIDLLGANSGRVTNLRRVTYVVLDEADRMFDMGFEPQVMKIMANIRPQKQTVLFSATFPRNMEALARKTLNKPVEIIVGGKSVVAPEITQVVEVREEKSKFLRLLELLGQLYDTDEEARTLVFVDRQESADGLLNDLMRKGYPCHSIHGAKAQEDRDSNIQDFKAGAVPILIATSVAARGLDVKQLKLVVNYDCPNHLEDYVHRAGRTGRAGNTGTAVTFVTPEQERYSVDIAKALKQSGQPIPEDLGKMVNDFIDKVKSGKEKASASGFGGKGLEKLDLERESARNRERKAYRTGDEPEEEEKDEGKEEELFKKAIAKAAPTATATSAAPAHDADAGKSLPFEEKIVVHKTEVPSTTGSTALDRVQQAVQSISSRLTRQGTGSGQPIDNKGPDAGAFHARLEINDFPQKARWAVTNRTNVAKILEATGTSITTKGNYYGAGKEPAAGEHAKLYILVEGDTEVVVTTAMRELWRLLREGTMAAADSESRAPASGRYNVV
ncbi:P-loop containing nucleoside triphosphate hydrolase protein [Eremomyces bilateralis CBS 781.70]|uniref:RNA helicase n=1 Tax=Eremomyces bilateralis CBS 781.70 TaxID=1392243 RepID=A0A6G1GGX2_9PEZI|nr:P-loop containing nucleoside triphosphate hydrolase protein [Eremomyces bilateralis CBS 781.70]KAF1817119.1 P-loop containing nucleoside triphosphate hydrolase protein [Eremomyces bilateralis CBS 781.70]